MRRRTVLAGIAATLAPAAHAQQPAMPMIGYLGPGFTVSDAFRVRAFRQGLKKSGYVEDQNAASTTVEPGITTIACQRLRPIWFIVRWQRLPRLARQGHSRQRRRQ
jgi:hypothetical protein